MRRYFSGKRVVCKEYRNIRFRSSSDGSLVGIGLLCDPTRVRDKTPRHRDSREIGCVRTRNWSHMTPRYGRRRHSSNNIKSCSGVSLPNTNSAVSIKVYVCLFHQFTGARIRQSTRRNVPATNRLYDTRVSSGIVHRYPSGVNDYRISSLVGHTRIGTQCDGVGSLGGQTSLVPNSDRSFSLGGPTRLWSKSNTVDCLSVLTRLNS